jgi:fructan beta-fructosidase
VDPGKIRLKILFDKSSLEVFFGTGEKVLTTYIYPDEDSDNLLVFANDGTVHVKSLKIWNLSEVSPGITGK